MNKRNGFCKHEANIVSTKTIDTGVVLSKGGAQNIGR